MTFNLIQLKFSLQFSPCIKVTCRIHYPPMPRAMLVGNQAVECTFDADQEKEGYLNLKSS